MKKIDLSQKIMEDIHSGKIRMKSKAQVNLENYLMFALLILLFSSSILFINFLVHIVSHNGSLEFLEFGRDGLSMIWENFPFQILAITAILLISTYLFYNHFDISYKKGSHILLASLAIICLASGFTLAYTHANDTVYNFAPFASLKNLATVKNISQNHGTIVKIIHHEPGIIFAKNPQGKIIVIRYKTNQPTYTTASIDMNKIQTIIDQMHFPNDLVKEQMKKTLVRQELMLAQLNKLKVEQETINQFEPDHFLKLIGNCQDNSCEFYNIKPIKNGSNFALQMN